GRQRASGRQGCPRGSLWFGGLPFGRQRASSRQGCPRGSLWFGGLPFGRQRASSRQGCPSGDPSGDFFSPSALKGRASGRSCPPTGPPLGKTLIGLRPRSRAQAGGTCVDRGSRRGCPHLNGDSLLASAGKRRASGRSCPPTGPLWGKP